MRPSSFEDGNDTASATVFLKSFASMRPSSFEDGNNPRADLAAEDAHRFNEAILFRGWKRLFALFNETPPELLQ